MKVCYIELVDLLWLFRHDIERKTEKLPFEIASGTESLFTGQSLSVSRKWSKGQFRCYLDGLLDIGVLVLVVV